MRSFSFPHQTEQLRDLIRTFSTDFGSGDSSAVSHLSSQNRADLNVLFCDDGRIAVPMTDGSRVVNSMIISLLNGVVRPQYVNFTFASLFHLIGSVDNNRAIYIVCDFLSATSIYAIKQCPVFVSFDPSGLNSLVNIVTGSFPNRVVRVIHDSGVHVSTNLKNVESFVVIGYLRSLWRTHRHKDARAAVLFLMNILRGTEKKKTVSYFQKSLKVSVPMYDFVEQLTVDLSDAQRLFLKHLLACTCYLCACASNSYFIPVPSKTIEKYARGCDTFELRDLGFILIKPDEPGRCREYAVAYRIYDAFVRLSPFSVKGVRTTKFVDLFTGKRTTATPRNQKFIHSSTQEHPVRIPKLIRTAMNFISPRPVNIDAMASLLRYRKTQMDSVEPGRKEFLSLRGKYINDRTCYSTVLGQVSDDVDGLGFHRYTAAHRVQKGGRLSEIGGGLQSASREMKLASTLGIPNLFNYDLVSSQVNGLIQEFARFNLNTEWLEDYRDIPDSKREYAEFIGIDVATWKICLLATIMGSSVSRNVNSSVFRALTDYQRRVHKNSIGLTLRFYKLLGSIKPLKYVLDKWHGILISGGGGGVSDSRAYTYANQKYLKNAAGMKALVGNILDDGRVKPLVDKNKLKRELAAFVLQGQEAAFIHHLTVLSEEFGFVVVGNEHDGLITIGEIPVAAIVKAGELSGLENPSMKKKDLFDGNDDWTKEELTDYLGGGFYSLDG
ncbi:MAG: hypothetical protein HQM14_20825 [SAR324 cluster bacterium]|nr:hypothetical protein [SAR324 cluster bacterium]